MRQAILARIASIAPLVLAGAAGAAETDAEFVAKAARGGLLEVELGRHASQHAADAGVRAFAQRMVSDHTRANSELAAIAQRQGLAVPKQIDAKQREQIQELTAKRGADFDEAYMEAMVEDHVHDVDEFREQADDAKSEVDRFAAKLLPTLEEHLAQARAIEDGLEKHAGAVYRGDRDAHQRRGADAAGEDQP
jgi:putative membrane protein